MIVSLVLLLRNFLLLSPQKNAGAENKRRGLSWRAALLYPTNTFKTLGTANLFSQGRAARPLEALSFGRVTVPYIHWLLAITIKITLWIVRTPASEKAAPESAQMLAGPMMMAMVRLLRGDCSDADEGKDEDKDLG